MKLLAVFVFGKLFDQLNEEIYRQIYFHQCCSFLSAPVKVLRNVKK